MKWTAILQHGGRTAIRAGGNSGSRRQHSWRSLLTLTLIWCSRWPRGIYYQVWKEICIAEFEAGNAWLPSLCWLQSASRVYLERQQPPLWFKRWQLLFLRFLVGIIMWMTDIKERAVCLSCCSWNTEMSWSLQGPDSWELTQSLQLFLLSQRSANDLWIHLPP